MFSISTTIFRRITVFVLMLSLFAALAFPLPSFALTLLGGDPFLYDERESVSGQIFRDPHPLMGAYTYSFPLTIPLGRSGLQPDPALTYSNQQSSQISPFGFGWSLNTPSIERVPRYGSDKLYSACDCVFFSSFDGEIIASSTTAGTEDFAPLVENGDFRKYEFVDNTWWRITDKSGVIYSFGQATSSRQNNPNVATSTFKWMLQEVRDPNNNYITYEYVKDSGQIYSATTTYTGHSGTAGMYTIEYFLENRSDSATSTLQGFPVVSHYRVSEIQVKVDGVWVRKYALSYVTGNNGVRSLLDTITETGKGEDASTLSFPVTDFDYSPQHTSPAKTWTEDGGYTIPVSFLGDTRNDQGVRFLDVNSDGLVDLLRSYKGETKEVYINDGDGTGWTLDSNYSIPVEFITFSYDDEGVRFADLNGDGYGDIFKSWKLSSDTFSKSVWINDKDGTGWSEDEHYTLPTTFITASSTSSSDDGARIIDVNGDGLPDIIQGITEGATTTKAVYINDGDGSGWTEDSGYTLPVVFVYNDGKDNGVRIFDVNGDSLPDLIQGVTAGATTTKAVYINNGDGTGWTQDINYNVPAVFIDDDADNGVRIADVNGDGLVDLMQSFDATPDEKHVWLNDGDGTGWTEDVNYTIPTLIFAPTDGSHQTGRIFDVNGDGLPDILERYADGVSVHAVYISDYVKTDLLKRVTTHTGGTVTINYTTTVLTTESGSSALGNPLLPLNLTVVETLVRDDGFGTVGTTTYAYRGGEYYWRTPYDRKFAGFATTTNTDPLGNVTQTFFHQGNGSQSSIGEYSDEVSKIGKPYRILISDGSSNLYKKTITKWDRAVLTNYRDFVKRTRIVDFLYDGNADQRATAIEFTYDDTDGNITEQVYYGEVTGSDDGTFVDSGSDKRTTSISYAASTSVATMSLPKTETTKNNGGTTVAEKKFYYDSLSHGTVSKGNFTKEEHLVEGSTYIDIERTYNSLGLVTQEKDPRDKATTFSYFMDLFVGTTTDPLGLITETYRDLSSGNVTKLVDPNSREFETSYDPLDRVIGKRIPDHLGSPSTLASSTDFAYVDTVGSRRIVRTDHLSSATSTDIYTYFDGFDRGIQTRIEAEGDNTYVVTDTTYNVRGDMSQRSLPYFASSTARSSMTGENDLLATTTYDALRRIVTIIDTEGMETHSYDQWKEVITDRLGNLKSFTSDAFGNLIQVDENSGTGTSTTVYTYDALDNLTKITDALANIRNFTYDNLSRLTNSEDLHDSSDTTFASTTYSYDSAGNVTTKLDQNNQTVNYTYDDGNRVLTENYIGGGGTEIEYGYDWCGEGSGRLCSATTTDVVTNLAHDALGNVTTEAKEINSTTHTTTYTYDRLGNQTQIVYPDALTVYYNHNSAGLLETVAALLAGSTTPQYLIEDLNYGPHGKVTYKKFGNGIESRYTYDANALYRLTDINTRLGN